MTARNPIRWLAVAAVLALGLAPAAVAQHEPAAPQPPARQAPKAKAAQRIVEEKSGTLSTQPGQQLRLTTDIGSVRISTHEEPRVDYRVRFETQAGQPGARELMEQFVVSARGGGDGVEITGKVPWKNFRGRLWVTFDVAVPRRYQLEVTTHAGNIELADVEGRAALLTYGGNVTAGSLGGTTRIETRGGHIRVGNVAGDLTAITAGGHVQVGRVEGNAVLRSAGGHVRAEYVSGRAELDTGGGNISIARAGGAVSAATAGGRIDFGETAGSIRARTGGGGIRVSQVMAPTELETSAGSIQLMRINGPVRASTSSGNITAWFVADAKLSSGSQLVCGQGDIVVFLPRNLAVTIDATIEMAADHRVIADPGLPVSVSSDRAGARGRVLRAEGSLNGGGHTLQLRTVAGNIRLRYADTPGGPGAVVPPPPPMQFDEMQRELESHQHRLEQLQRRAQAEAERHARESSRLVDLQRRIAERFWGRVRVDSKEQSKRLVRSVRPAYPEVAKQAGIEGPVRLDVMIDRDGNVEDVKVLSGHRVLAEAAAAAVRQWRYEPVVINDRQIPVVTFVVVEFKLR